MRLDKYLNDILNLGRKDLHRIIKAGRVTVNGEVQSSPDHKISEDSDVVCMDGEKIMYRKYFYYMMNKPDGYITAMDDRRQATIAELLPKAVLDQNVFPVGRLDKDTFRETSWMMRKHYFSRGSIWMTARYVFRQNWNGLTKINAL